MTETQARIPRGGAHPDKQRCTEQGTVSAEDLQDFKVLAPSTDFMGGQQVQDTLM